MNDVAGIFAFPTSNYDAMTGFFRDLRFDVREDARDQLVPLFNNGRGAYVCRGDLFFNLEESTDGAATACFNLLAFNYTPDELAGITLDRTTEVSLYGTFHTFISPDGGKITISS